MFQKCSREGLAGIKPHCSQFSIQKHFHLCITVLASLSYMESLCSLHVIKAFHCVSSMSKMQQALTPTSFPQHCAI